MELRPLHDDCHPLPPSTILFTLHRPTPTSTMPQHPDHPTHLQLRGARALLGGELGLGVGRSGLDSCLHIHWLWVTGSDLMFSSPVSSLTPTPLGCYEVQERYRVTKRFIKASAGPALHAPALLIASSAPCGPALAPRGLRVPLCKMEIVIVSPS